MRIALIMTALLILPLVAGCGSVSRSGTLYKYQGRTWLVIRETRYDKDAHILDYNNFTSTDRLAIIRPNGKVQIVATREVTHDESAYAIIPDDTISPEAERLLGSDPISKVEKYGRWIRQIETKDMSQTGGLKIKTSKLQDDSSDEQVRATEEAPANTENISTTSPETQDRGGGGGD